MDIINDDDGDGCKAHCEHNNSQIYLAFHSECSLREELPNTALILCSRKLKLKNIKPLVIC